MHYWHSLLHNTIRSSQLLVGGASMLFARKHNEYGCPMCGRLPVIKALQTDKYNESSILAVLAG